MAQTGVFRKMRAEGGPAWEADLERLGSMVSHHTEGRVTTYATLPEAQLAARSSLALAPMKKRLFIRGLVPSNTMKGAATV